jgi:hypothetical protein
MTLTPQAEVYSAQLLCILEATVSNLSPVTTHYDRILWWFSSLDPTWLILLLNATHEVGEMPLNWEQYEYFNESPLTNSQYFLVASLFTNVLVRTPQVHCHCHKVWQLCQACLIQFSNILPIALGTRGSVVC